MTPFFEETGHLPDPGSHSPLWSRLPVANLAIRIDLLGAGSCELGGSGHLPLTSQ